MEMLWKFLVIAQFVTTIWGYFVMEAEAEVTTARAPSVQMPHKITDCPPGQLTDCREGYEEYYLEHSVSQKDAKKSLKEIIEKSKNYQRPAYCGECTSSIQKYCLSPHLLHDHCCCDLRHGKEELPWIPHSCYIGQNECKSSLGSCLMYAEHKICCCDQLLIEQWKSIFSHALRVHPTQNIIVILPLYLVFRYLL
ncbi:uncharacterized protein LOC129786232 [Lutzomyia longipalpis]|uniref:Putative conserved secreted protein n=1 Tax=Lutzomyia longipalpis TaxID=7200 RepID=A0A7G3AF89_LUTLO|nr:uncharacterized protein LOC129786232 [Lutzomyia longipalpis]XP_055677071.1 uncharacterized protein LOC129786232 [Lutzomyia longipalpis]XP_055677072.1 uncharacterized protein LOC129786232 [Lutzomyia longipalpis]XP_055677073.1 uncharacterized protein LOC129786232 [Lutzomyia longipalpis]XP_055677074.1 uncharacterized protein LOC129786232 [Lutzomyia longipalpis]